MADIKKVIKGLETCIPMKYETNEEKECRHEQCPYGRENYKPTNGCFWDLMADALELLKEQKQKIDVLEDQNARLIRLKNQQPKKGTWEVKIRHHPYPDGREYKKFCCSVCGNDVDDHEDSDFCPWCGADMRKDGEQE